MKIELKDDEIRAVIAKQFDDVKTLVVGEKNKRYGVRNIFEPGPFTSDASPDLTIRARMGDKVQRLQNLWQGVEGTADETIEDTVKDLMGYCGLWLACNEIKKTGGKAKEESKMKGAKK
ncbi:MAG: hypothetical protein J6W10_03900 [Kiritimatiellae bacterium]|nr:hypothetical protein [Kiritimatiellia bacterium]